MTDQPRVLYAREQDLAAEEFRRVLCGCVLVQAGEVGRETIPSPPAKRGERARVRGALRTH
jgi:hypothetical protein